MRRITPPTDQGTGTVIPIERARRKRRPGNRLLPLETSRKDATKSQKIETVSRTEAVKKLRCILQTLGLPEIRARITEKRLEEIGIPSGSNVQVRVSGDGKFFEAAGQQTALADASNERLNSPNVLFPKIADWYLRIFPHENRDIVAWIIRRDKEHPTQERAIEQPIYRPSEPDLFRFESIAVALLLGRSV